MCRFAFCSEFNKEELASEAKNVESVIDLVKRSIISETQNFLIQADVNQLAEGHLLICTKQHFSSIAELPKKFYPELEEINKRVRRVLTKRFSSPIFFEHGEVGSSVEHLHLHAVPAADVFKGLSKRFGHMKKIEKLKELKRNFNKEIPYIFYEKRNGERYVFDIYEEIPSQFMRKVVAEERDYKNWDWKEEVTREKTLNTVRKLEGAFK